MPVEDQQSAFRRRSAGVFLILGSLLLLVSSLFTTSEGGETAEYVAAVADRREAEAAAAMLALFGFALLIPGVLGGLALLRGRGAMLGNVAAFVATLGLAFFMILVGSTIWDVAATDPSGGIDREQYVALSESLEDSAMAVPVFVVALLGSFAGLILYCVAHWRGGVVGVWVPVVVVVGFVLTFFSEDSRVLNVLSSLFFSAALVGIGLELLRSRPRGAESAMVDRAEAREERAAVLT